MIYAIDKIDFCTHKELEEEAKKLQQIDKVHTMLCEIKERIFSPPGMMLNKPESGMFPSFDGPVKKEYSFCELINCSEEEFGDCVRRRYYRAESCLKRHTEEAEQNGTKLPGWTKLHKSMPHNLYKQFYIITKIFEQWVPMIDCDCEDEKNEAIEELQRRHIPYTIFNSSSSHYWIFCDKLTTLDASIKFLLTMPGDHRYPWCSGKRGALVVRALPKNLHVPTIIDKFDESKFSKHFTYWIKCFEEHWHSDLMEWLLSKQVVEAF